MRKRRGVSPIVSAVLLTAIVVVLGVSVFLWSTYSLSVYGGGINTFYKLREEQLQEDIVIEHVQFIDGNNLTIYVRNIGSIDTRLKTIYIMNLDNTSQYAVISIGGDGYYLGVGELGNISITIPDWEWIANNAYKIKISTSRGTAESAILVTSSITRIARIYNVTITTSEDPNVTYGIVSGSYTDTQVKDGNYQQIKEEKVPITTDVITNGNFTNNASGWINTTSGDAVNGLDDTGHSGYSIYTMVEATRFLHLAEGNGNWSQSFTISSIPTSVMLTFNYSVPEYTHVNSFNLTVYIIDPNNESHNVWTHSPSGTEDWTTVSKNVSSIFTTSGTYTIKFYMYASVYKLLDGNGKAEVYWDDVGLAVTIPYYVMDVYYTFNTSNVSVSSIRNIEYKFYGNTSGETIHIAIYNFTASNWHYIGDVTNTANSWINITLPSDYQDFINTNGSLLVRYYTDYDTIGPDSLYIDYQAIQITYVEYI